MEIDWAFILIGFVALPLLCIVFEQAWPSIRKQAVFRQAFFADALWYVAQSLVARFVAPLVVFFVVWPLLQWQGVTGASYWQGYGPLAELALGWQIFWVFILGDFLSYWQHRLFHLRAAWPVHAVHHSSKEMDWLSSTRFHPLNEIGAQLIYVTPLIAIGFSPLAFIWLAPFTSAYAVILHGNLRWHFGPLSFLFASPIYHRWHHTSAIEGRDKNFAGFLPIWDVVFGTYYFPKGKPPTEFGIDEPMPDGFFKQLLYPLGQWFRGG